MTRFKELERIERAIEHKNKAELEWALWYCRMRIKIARLKNHDKTWRQREKKVLQALEDLKE